MFVLDYVVLLKHMPVTSNDRLNIRVTLRIYLKPNFNTHAFVDITLHPCFAERTSVIHTSRFLLIELKLGYLDCFTKNTMAFPHLSTTLC